VKIEFIQTEKRLPKLNDPILIEGLPGIGNVGKIVADFLIDELKAKKIFEIYSYSLPNSVFVNDENLVEMPTIEIYYKQFNKNGKSDLLILTGDVQPTDEESSYEFTEEILNLFEKFNGKEIITMGGIGLQEISKKPLVYCTGNSKEIVTKYMKGTNLNNKLYGVVGPIIGVTGLLLGLGSRRGINAIALLAETIAHPMYLGIKGAKETVKVLDKKLDLKLNLKKLEADIKDIEKEMLKTTKELQDLQKNSAIKKVNSKYGEQSYIG